MSDYGMWLPKSASTFAAEIDASINVVHLLMLVMFVVWGIFFIYFIIKFRSSSNQPVNYSGFSNKSLPIAMVAFVALFDIYMLAKHDIPFWNHLKTDFPAAAESTVVRVVGQQFAWNIHYPGVDGIFGKTDMHLVNEQSNPIGLVFDDPAAKDDIVTLGQLHLPVNKPVIVHLTTKDVIHSFSLPIMRVKQDIIPGMRISTWFEPTRTGDWQIACAQLCGNSHFKMKGILKVETQEEFDAWLIEKAPTEDDDDVW